MLIVEDGTVASGQYIVAGNCIAPVRIMENFLGKPIKEALPGTPIRIVGFTPLPPVGTRFAVVGSKKEAESKAKESAAAAKAVSSSLLVAEDAALRRSDDTAIAAPTVLPIIIKTDAAGTREAVAHELAKLPQHPTLEARVIARSVGAITEGEIKMLAGSTTAGIGGGFNAK